MTPFPTRLIRISQRRRADISSVRPQRTANTITYSFRADATLPVSSTAIARIEYDPDTQECTYTFFRGGSFTSIIPQIEVERWANSDSPGSYYNSHIRGRY